MRVQVYNTYETGLGWKEHGDGEFVIPQSTIVDVPDELLAKEKEVHELLKNIKREIADIVFAKIAEDRKNGIRSTDGFMGTTLSC